MKGNENIAAEHNHINCSHKTERNTESTLNAHVFKIRFSGTELQMQNQNEQQRWWWFFFFSLFDSVNN